MNAALIHVNVVNSFWMIIEVATHTTWYCVQLFVAFGLGIIDINKTNVISDVS